MEDLTRKIREQAAEIVRNGDDIRRKIAKLTAESAHACAEQAEGLLQMSNAVMEGAVEGAKQAVPDHAGSALREVIDGIGDTFNASAQAVKLTLDEARSAGRQFASEDLERIIKDFRTVGDLFLETVTRSVAQFQSHLSSQSETIRRHAQQTLSQAQSRLSSVAETAQSDLLKLTSETMKAGASAARQATGVFFTEMGRQMEHWGDLMTRRDQE